ncbi:G4 quadruplex nucleic acid binding protein [Elasticomyces elasticus]|uniref:G4 quadruplex nucleic acid binding protein n=1 Tax=Exophiala sideris TaxID=1016849 RepID=A0ABR0IU21_9EURO|nr:G4 quadruplex nucleic acid binding protein [Elasticomyces elasticus]KAK5020700.1 G4 quadruplex nucleic acid binding protein [Exophiala sideris]KAK5022586.1 G4 quadruplex nucleic acid binding protein [Exophiala sideris]KAK5047847.1 G4 quadruplex nucleic acid binding protein [Exophiala sideris]KAK5175960.1 G4 quadruplex nucleic acid binding protein [Eurotiomycetes sp. CCFEE 6388]
MQNRKVVVIANLKPVNMRSTKSTAMVLAASPPSEEGTDPYAADRVVELVDRPEGAEARDPMYFEGWPHGEGKGSERLLNPKKTQWEAIQPGFFTSEALVVGFDAFKTDIEGSEKENLTIEGKEKCTVLSLKGAIVR